MCALWPATGRSSMLAAQVMRSQQRTVPVKLYRFMEALYGEARCATAYVTFTGATPVLRTPSTQLAGLPGKKVLVGFSGHQCSTCTASSSAEAAPAAHDGKPTASLAGGGGSQQPVGDLLETAACDAPPPGSPQINGRVCPRGETRRGREGVMGLCSHEALPRRV